MSRTNGTSRASIAAREVWAQKTPEQRRALTAKARRARSEQAAARRADAMTTLVQGLNERQRAALLAALTTPT